MERGCLYRSRSGELYLPAFKFPPFFSYSKFNMLGAPSLTGSRDFTWAEKFLYQGGWIIDCRFLALFLGLVFGYFDFEGMTLLRKMLSVRVVCCHSFELMSTKIFVRLQACRKKVGNTYPKRHRPVPVKRTAWNKGGRKLNYPGWPY